MSASRQFAVVTGASSGTVLELAKCCAREGFDLLIAADEAEIDDAAAEIRKLGTNVAALQADLSTTEGVDRLYAAADGRPSE
jgi:NAD(P)-dependent dehydrogenase (short-subunit alcohol dehydrogenase family)